MPNVDFSERYARTLFPGTARVCGIDLPRLTLWRVEALRAIDSKFLSADGSSTITPADLTLAISCLFCEYPSTPDLRPTWRLKWIAHRLQRNKDLFLAECRRFIEYLTIFTLRPELWEQADSSSFRAISAPHGLSSIAALMELGMSHAEAWQTSPAYAQWLITTHAERKSDKVRFVREDDSYLEPDELETMTENQIIELARQELGSDFDRWYQARKDSQNGKS